MSAWYCSASEDHLFCALQVYEDDDNMMVSMMMMIDVSSSSLSSSTQVAVISGMQL